MLIENRGQVAVMQKYFLGSLSELLDFCPYWVLLRLKLQLVLPCALFVCCASGSSCIAVCCSVLQCVTVWCTVMIVGTTRVAVCSNCLLWQQFCCSLLQCVAVYCSLLHCYDYMYDLCCHVLQLLTLTAVVLQDLAVWYRVMQWVALLWLHIQLMLPCAPITYCDRSCVAVSRSVL